jgi:phosphoglycolate phosphatase
MSSDQPGRPSVIVFDWDNTLVDTWPTIHQALFVTFEAMGHRPWSLEETKSRVRHSLRDAFPVLFGDRWTEAREIFYRAFEQSHIDRLVPIEGAAELLEGLADAGVDMAVLSNKTGRYLRDEAEHLKWAGYFAAIVGAGDAERDKPARQALELALAPFGCEPGGDVWVIGDSGIDLEIAHRTGCVPILMHREDLDAEEFVDWPPEIVFKGCNSLKEFIARW